MTGGIFRADCTIQQLEILFATEESVLCGHPQACNHMILYQTSQRLAGCRHKVLVVRVGDIVCLRPCNLTFYRDRVTDDNNRGKATHEENVCSSLMYPVSGALTR